MISGAVEILCRIASEMGDTTVNGLFVKMPLASFDLNLFRAVQCGQEATTKSKYIVKRDG